MQVKDENLPNSETKPLFVCIVMVNIASHVFLTFDMIFEDQCFMFQFSFYTKIMLTSNNTKTSRRETN